MKIELKTQSMCYNIAIIPVARIANAAPTFRRLLTNNLVWENLVPMAMRPHIREMPIINKGVTVPNNGMNGSPAIRPAIKALTPTATDRNISWRGLRIKIRFRPFLIFSVSMNILNAIMKQSTRMTTLGMNANLSMNVPPSSEPSQYIKPCPADNAPT